MEEKRLTVWQIPEAGGGKDERKKSAKKDGRKSRQKHAINAGEYAGIAINKLYKLYTLFYRYY